MLNSPIMTSNSAPTPWVVSASNENHPAYHGIDGNVSTYWQGSIGAETWWKIYGGGTPFQIDTLTMKFYPGYGLNAFKIQGSDDDSTWTDVYSGSAANNSDVQTFSFPISQYYKYFRVLRVSSYDGGWVLVYEFTVSNSAAEPSCYLGGRRDRMDARAVSARNQLV